MDGALRAARIGDQVGSHGSGWSDFWKDMWCGIAAAVVVGALCVAAAIFWPVVVASVAVGATVGTVAAAAGGAVAAMEGVAIVGAVASAVGTGASVWLNKAKRDKRSRLAGEGNSSSKDGAHLDGTPCGKIVGPGSPDVFIEGLPVARATIEKGSHDSDPDLITQGCKTVIVNGLPLAREGDSVACGGKIIHGCEHTWVGGPQAGTATDDGPSERWFWWIEKVGMTADVIACVMPWKTGIQAVWKMPGAWTKIAYTARHAGVFLLHAGLVAGGKMGAEAAIKSHWHQTENEADETDMWIGIGLNAAVALKPVFAQWKNAPKWLRSEAGENPTKTPTPTVPSPTTPPKVPPAPEVVKPPCPTCAGESAPKQVLGPNGKAIGPNAPPETPPKLIDTHGMNLDGSGPPRPGLINTEGEPLNGKGPLKPRQLYGPDDQPIHPTTPATPPPKIIVEGGLPADGSGPSSPKKVLGLDGRPIGSPPAPVPPLVDADGVPLPKPPPPPCPTCSGATPPKEPPTAHELAKKKAEEWNEKHPDWLWALDSGVWYGNFEHGATKDIERTMRYFGWLPPEKKEGGEGGGAHEGAGSATEGAPAHE